jgi:hypothetical protein
MIDHLIQNFPWTLITIDDPNFLSGKSISDAIQTLLEAVKFKFVILDNIDGSGKDWLIYTLQKEKDAVTPVDNFLKILCDITQLDWGDFFLFKEYPRNWSNFEGKPYSDIIAQTDTTVRMVDNQYIYIYTPYQEIVNIIRENYEVESIKMDILENLDYPY